MAANVNILTAKKTILFYLLKPVVKIKENALKVANLFNNTKISL